MSRKGDCYDNAPMESFFHTPKTELVYHRQYATRAEATAAVVADPLAEVTKTAIAVIDDDAIFSTATSADHKGRDDLLYTTGFYLHTFGHLDNIIVSIKRHSRRFLEQLFAETGSTVTLGAPEGDMVVICDIVGHQAELVVRARVRQSIEARIDAHATGLGKVLMTYRSKEEIKRRYENRVLHGQAKQTMHSSERLFQLLPEIRRARYALEDSERDDGIRGVASAIVNPANRATCAVGVEGPARLLNDQAPPHTIDRVRNTALSIADYILHSNWLATASSLKDAKEPASNLRRQASHQG
jgi:DNA-binding IclR family transcriptional regulator